MSCNCQDLEDDLNAAKRLKECYPNKLLVVRYEDLSLNPESETQKILNFLGLQFTKEIKEFLDKHTKGRKNSIKFKNDDKING